MRLSKRAEVLQESAIRKLDLVCAKFPDVHYHRVNIGQPDVATPGPLLEAIRGFQPDVISYGPASGLPACREAAAAYHARWCSALTAEHVAVTTGGSEALLFAFTALCDPGDEILVPEPFYTNYNGFATVAGARVRGIPTSLDDGFALPDNDTLDRLVSPTTRAIVFSNPGNPTGAVMSASEVARIANWAASRGIFCIADEVYRRIWFDESPTSALEIESAKDAVIVIDSMSKTYSACGLRLGFLISRNAQLMEKVERLGQARLGPQPLAQHVAMAGLSLDDAYYADIRDVYRSRVSALYDALMGIPGVKTHRPEGAFYLMAELPIDDADRFARWLVTDFRREGQSLVVAPGTGFYTQPELGRRQVRLAAVLEEPILRQVGALLTEAVATYPQ